MAITRELSIIYGSTTVGAGTNHLIDAPFRINKSYERITVDFDLIVTGTSDSNFASVCSTIETAFRTPRQRLRILFNSASHGDYDPSGSVNSGFDAEPTISKVGSDFDTGRSRRYSVSITARLPADLAGQDGRLTSSVVLSFTDSVRRRLSVTGTYTALVGNSARTQFNAAIDAYISSLTTGFGGIWEGPFDRQEAANDTDKTLNFSRVYEELIFNQSTGTLDDTQIRRQSLQVTTLFEAPGDSSFQGNRPNRFKVLSVAYSCSVDKTATQDLKSVYDVKVKPFLLATALTVAGGGSSTIVSHSPSFDFAENRLAVSMTVFVTGSSNVITARVSTSDSVSSGWELIPVWDGDRLTRDEFPGPIRLIRTITATATVLGLASNSGVDGLFGDLLANVDEPGQLGLLPDPEVREHDSSPDGGRLKKRLLGFDRQSSPRRLGFVGESPIDVVDDTIVIRFEYYVKRSGQGSSTGQTVSR